MEIVKQYPLWGQFIIEKEQWIGGWIEDFGDQIDKVIFDGEIMKTPIIDIILRPNGTGAHFEIVGRDFTCGFDTKYGEIISHEDGWITFSGYGGHQWRVIKRDEDS